MRHQACIRWTCWQVSPGWASSGWRCTPRARIQRNIARALSTAAHDGARRPILRPMSIRSPTGTSLLPRRKSSPCPAARKIPSTPGTKHPGHRRQWQRQDPFFRQTLPHADAQQLCGHRSQRVNLLRTEEITPQKVRCRA